ncbi:MAG: hypothetical protein ABDH91_04105 [Bacteroidia bacterium]
MKKDFHPSVNHVALFWTDAFLIATGVSIVILCKLGKIQITEVTGGDSYEYLFPFYYLLKQGSYWPDYRMPGYSVLYLIFLLFSPTPAVAQSMLVFANLAFTLLTVYVSVNHLHKRGKKLGAHLMGIVWITSPISHNWVSISMDLPAALLMILSIIALMEKKHAWAGIGFMVMIFSRPVALPALIVAAGYVWHQHNWASPFRSFALKKALLGLLLPFSIAEGIWIARNYLRYGDFRPAAGTGTMLHEPLYQGAAYYGYRIARALGYSSDSRITYMLWGGWDVDTSLFIRLLPPEAQEPQLRALLIEVLIRVQKFRSNPTCNNEMLINEKASEALYKIKIPTYKRILYLLYHTFFTDYAFMYRSLSPSAWLLYMPRHPRYFMASFTFLIWLLLATITVVLPRTVSVFER